MAPARRSKVIGAVCFHTSDKCKAIVKTARKSDVLDHRCHWRRRRAALVQRWCVGGTYWGLSWICLWLLMGGSVALVLNSSPFFKVSRICSVSVNAHTNETMKLYHRAQPAPRNPGSGVGKGRELLGPTTELTGTFHTFFRKPPWLRADADWTAVLLVLRGTTQIVPHTLGADPTQVGALRLNALVHSLLLRWARNICNHQH